MPTFDVTVTKRLRLTASDMGKAEEMAEGIETGDIARPPTVSVVSVQVTRVERV